MLPLAFAWCCAAAFAASLCYFLYSYFGAFGAAVTGAAVLGPALIDVVLFTAFALHHSLFARTGLKRLVSRHVSAPLERAVYTLVSSVLFALVCWAWRPLPGVLYTLEPPWSVIGYAVVAAGVIVTGVSARALDILDLAGVRQVQRGRDRVTLPRPSLKTDGLYGVVRHPVYFGWILLVFGVPTMTLTRLVFALVSTAYLALAVPLEERSLGETFGADYASYKQRTRWRMIPGLY